MPRVAAIFLLAASGGLASGCSGMLENIFDRLDARSPEPATIASRVTERPVAVPVAAGGDTGRPRPKRKPLSAANVAASAAAPAPEIADPATLVGLSRDEVRQRLGAPDGQSDGPPAKVWNYADRGCEVRLYFYFDLVARQYRLLHHEAVSLAPDAVPDLASDSTGAGPDDATVQRCAGTVPLRLAAGEA